VTVSHENQYITICELEAYPPAPSICSAINYNEGCSALSCDELGAIYGQAWRTSTGNARRGSDQVCGESDAGFGQGQGSRGGGDQECYGGQVTHNANSASETDTTIDGWVHGNSICRAVGARLCTAAELQAEETRGSGCAHDREWVWSSSLCTENVALGKETSQSSEGWGGAPGRAVDGNTNGDWGGGSCTHTQNGETEWWQVDLGASTPVATVNLYHRTNCCQDRLGGAVVTVSATADYTSGGTNCGTVDVAAMSAIDCGGAEGQFVTVSHAGQYITICEAEVWNQGGDGHQIAVGGNQWGSDLCGNVDEDGSDECAIAESDFNANGSAAPCVCNARCAADDTSHAVRCCADVDGPLCPVPGGIGR